MQNFSPRPAPHRKPQPSRTAQRPWLLACLLLAATCTISAQTLARPGWAGSGLNSDPWWKHAVFYQIHTAPDLEAITARFDALRSLGIDALLLPMPTLPAQTSNTANPAPTLDAFDELLRQASRRDIRVLLTFAGNTAELTATARFWLSHGVAGFHLLASAETDPQTYQAAVESLRKITSSSVGERIVISDFNPGPSNASAQFQIDSQLEQPDAASLRTLLEQSFLAPNVLLDLQPHATLPESKAPSPASARAIAAILLTTHAAALIDADTPNLSTDGLVDWYQKLIALHHGNATLRYGNVTMLNFDAQNALVWVSSPAAGPAPAPAVVGICNLSSAPLQLSLRSEMKNLKLRGSFLRTLLRSDDAMGSQDLNSVSVPPFGVYIGELRR